MLLLFFYIYNKRLDSERAVVFYCRIANNLALYNKARNLRKV